MIFFGNDPTTWSVAKGDHVFRQLRCLIRWWGENYEDRPL